MVTFNKREQKILKLGRAYIDEPDKWTTVQLARYANGKSCRVQDPEAASFCALGALLRASGDKHWKDYDLPLVQDLADKLVRYLPEEKRQDCGNWRNVARFNNTSTHGDVLALFDRALA